MNGAQHVTEALRLEQLSLRQWDNDQALHRLTMQQAQLHATLALVAAAVGGRMPGPAVHWDEVFS